MAPDRRLTSAAASYINAQEQFKLELMTVITSPPGSGDQRWHQGWRYLFHPDERLPPYADYLPMPHPHLPHPQSSQLPARQPHPFDHTSIL